MKSFCPTSLSTVLAMSFTFFKRFHFAQRRHRQSTCEKSPDEQQQYRLCAPSSTLSKLFFALLQYLGFVAFLVFLMAVHVVVLYILINYALLGGGEALGDSTGNVTRLSPIYASVANQSNKWTSARRQTGTTIRKVTRPRLLVSTNDSKIPLATKHLNLKPMSLALHNQNNNNTTLTINGTVEPHHQQSPNDNLITSDRQQQILLQNINEIIQSMKKETPTKNKRKGGNKSTNTITTNAIRLIDIEEPGAMESKETIKSTIKEHRWFTPLHPFIFPVNLSAPTFPNGQTNKSIRTLSMTTNAPSRGMERFYIDDNNNITEVRHQTTTAKQVKIKKAKTRSSPPKSEDIDGINYDNVEQLLTQLFPYGRRIAMPVSDLVTVTEGHENKKNPRYYRSSNYNESASVKDYRESSAYSAQQPKTSLQQLYEQKDRTKHFNVDVDNDKASSDTKPRKEQFVMSSDTRSIMENILKAIKEPIDYDPRQSSHFRFGRPKLVGAEKFRRLEYNGTEANKIDPMNWMNYELKRNAKQQTSNDNKTKVSHRPSVVSIEPTAQSRKFPTKQRQAKNMIRYATNKKRRLNRIYDDYHNVINQMFADQVKMDMSHMQPLMPPPPTAHQLESQAYYYPHDRRHRSGRSRQYRHPRNRQHYPRHHVHPHLYTSLRYV